MANVFYGEKVHQVDEKNRIRIPSCFREMLGAKYVFKKGGDGQIEVYAKDDADMLLLNVQESLKDELFDPKIAKALKQFCASFYPVNEDSQGRVVIPETLIKHAKIEKDVITTGVINHLVITRFEADEIEEPETSIESATSILWDRIKEKKNGI